MTDPTEHVPPITIGDAFAKAMDVLTRNRIPGLSANEFTFIVIDEDDDQTVDLAVMFPTERGPQFVRLGPVPAYELDPDKDDDDE